MPNRFAVYVMTNRARVLYVGATGHLRARVEQQRLGLGSPFVREHRITRVVHVEFFDRPRDAVRRELRLRRMLRWRLVRLIARTNPDWRDVSEPSFVMMA